MQPETIALCQRIGELSPGKVAKPTLVYFDIIGIAWPIRCLLHLKDIDYELIKIPIELWMERDENDVQLLKQSFRNGHVPLYVDLEVGLNQSHLILEYLMDRHGLDGATLSERFAVREVMLQAYDALFHWNGLFRVNVRLGLPDKIADARMNAFMGEGEWPVASNGYDNNLRAFDKYLQANQAGSGFFVGNSLTGADLYAFNVLCNWYKALAPARFSQDYPLLEAFIQKIAAIPGVADYIAKKQEATTWFPLPHAAMRLTSKEELQGLTGKT